MLKILPRTNKLLLLIIFLIIGFAGFAQAPNLLNYQGVARNSVGNPLPNQAMNLRLSIHNLSSSGTVVYSETRSITTNAGGLFAVQIGSAGSSSSIGTLGGVNWLVGEKYLQVEIDPEANNNFSNLGTVQLISVPYAISSSSAGSAVTATNLSGLNTSVATLNSISGTNTGDNAVNSLYSGLVSNATHTGDATGNTVLTVKGINGKLMSSLETGILKNTTGTGVPSVAIAGTDYLTPTGSAAGLTNFPTLNQNTTGNAATATKIAAPKNINGVAFDGSSDITIPATAAADQLTGTSLKSTVTGSNLTSVGTLANLTVTNPIAGSVTGNAATATKLAAAKNINGVAFDGSSDITISATADAGILTGTNLNSTITSSSLTSVGTLTNLTVTNPIVGSVAGNASTATTAGNITATSNNTLTTLSNLSSVGTITSGVWSATTLSIEKGGTGLTSTGSNGQVLTSTGSGTLTWTSLSSGTAGIPYTGATSAVNLGAYDLKVNGLTIGKGSGNITGNTVTGDEALKNNTTGSGNTVNGYQALYFNTTGNKNTANGMSALLRNTVGEINTAIGYEALTSNTTGSYNTANGVGALQLNTTGGFNTAIGTNSLLNNNGSYNIAVGSASLQGNTIGASNIAIGFNTNSSNTSGNNNTAVGNGSLGTNTTGSYNTALGLGADVASNNLNNATAIGYNASVAASNTIQLGNSDVTDVKTSGTITAGTITYPNTPGTNGYYLKTDGTGTATWAAVSGSGIPYTGATGAVNLGAYDLKVNGLTIGKGSGNITGNTVTGDEALKNNTTGYANTVNGYQSLYFNTTGNRNTANGMSALLRNTIGEINTAIGYEALTSNTSGSYNTANGVGALQTNTTGGFNTAIGTNSLLNNNGSYNIAMGSASLQGNTSGASNTAIGFNSNSSNTSGNNNTAVGNGSLGTNTTGSNNTAIGLGADVATNNLSNATAIGYNASVAASNSIQLGNTNVTNVQTSGTITAGTITYPNTHGTSGQVLTSLGSGTLGWTTAQNAIDTASLSNRINAVNLGLNNKLNKTDTSLLNLTSRLASKLNYSDTSDMLFNYRTALNNKLNVTDTASLSNRINTVLYNKVNYTDTSNMLFNYRVGLNNKLNMTDTSTMLSSYLRKSGNAATATLAGNITATTNTTLTSLANLNTVGTITSGTISLTTNISTTGTLKAGAITYPNTAGTDGYYLKTDGTGTASWAAVSGSGIPYTGATGAVNLGAYDLKVQGLTVGLGNGAVSSNTAFGLNVLKNASGIDNTAMGKEALYTNTSGYSNVAIGTVALYSNSTGGENSAFGMYSLYNNTGSFNTAVGMHALESNTTGSNNTAIGRWANVSSGGLTNATAVGYNAQATASNSVRLGDINVSSIGGNVGWTAASDVRIKKNITNTKYGLSTVLQLRPVEYNLISNDLKQVGFIAQEVKKLVPEVVTGKEGDLKKGEILGITYANLVPVLTKAIQEQQTIIDNQNKRLAALELIVKKLAAAKK